MSWAVFAIAVPFLLVLATGYVKLAVVLAILRRALGGGAVPPPSVTAVIALLLALFVTAPLAETVWAQAGPSMVTAAGKGGIGDAGAVAEKAAAPVRAFLAAHAPARERQSFVDLAKRLRAPGAARDAVRDDDLLVLATAFATAELKAAFRVGFFLFLPFLLIELVVGTVLLALGMSAASPETVSLPFKLLLFVAVDGWHLLVRGLVLGET
jgi:type III secretion protein R